MGPDGLFQASPDAVAHDGVADLLGDGEADARLRLIAAIQHLNEKKPSAPLFTAADGQEFLSLSEAAWGRSYAEQTPWACLSAGKVPAFGLGREPLAAAIAASGDDATTTLGGHASTETVTALTNEFGRLIGTLHLF